MLSADFDPAESCRSYAASLPGTPLIDRLTSQLDVGSTGSLVTFGAGVCEKLSHAADDALEQMENQKTEDPTPMLEELGRVLREFDPAELREKKGLAALFGGKKAEDPLEKASRLGAALDRCYVWIRGYQVRLKTAAAQLESLLNADMETLKSLESYIVAADEGAAEIGAYLKEREEELRRAPDPSGEMETGQLRQALQLVEKRAVELRTAEQVALQTAVMLQLERRNALILSDKLESAVLVAIPVFRQTISQAISLRRQQAQTRALNAAARRRDEEAPVPVPDPEPERQAILQGLSETKKMRLANELSRRENLERLEKLRAGS